MVHSVYIKILARPSARHVVESTLEWAGRVELLLQSKCMDFLRFDQPGLVDPPYQHQLPVLDISEACDVYAVVLSAALRQYRH